MPPRKRLRRSGEDPRRDDCSSGTPSTASQASTTTAAARARTPRLPPSTQAGAAADTIAAPAPPSPYRTRHRRAVRGPDLAALEGGSQDLVPPSDDEEYDEWRAVRAVARREREEAMEMEEGSEEGDDEDEEVDESQQAGPSRIAMVPAWSPLTSPSRAAGRLRSRSRSPRIREPAPPPVFVTFFDSDASGSFSSSRCPSASPTVAAAVHHNDDSDEEDDGHVDHDTLPPLPLPLPPPTSRKGKEVVRLWPKTRASQMGALTQAQALQLPSPSSARPHRSSSPAHLSPVKVQGKPRTSSSLPPLSPHASGDSERSKWESASPGVHEHEGHDPGGVDGELGDDVDDDHDMGAAQTTVVLELALSQPVEENVPMREPSASPDAPALDADVDPGFDIDTDVEQSFVPVDFEESLAPLPPPLELPDIPSPPHSPPDPLDIMSEGEGLQSPPPASRPNTRLQPSQRQRTQPPLLPSPPRSSARIVLSSSPPQESPSPPAPLELAPASPVVDEVQNDVHSNRDRSSSLTPPPPSPPASRRDPQQPPPPTQLQQQPLPPPLPEDPALLLFRGARSFRTRTAMQLQPYTKERQMYQSALRKGGLAKGRHAVAPAAVVAANKDTDTSESGNQSGSSDSDATPPDAIVIGGTQEQQQQQQQGRPAKRQREPVPLEDADFDEYFMRFGEVAVEEDEEAAKRLQRIARERLVKEKEARRQRGAEDKARRNFEALIAGEDKARREKEREERRVRKKREREEKEKRDAERALRREEVAEEKRVREAKRAEREEARRVQREKEKTRTIPTPTSNGTKTPRTKTYGRKRRPVVDLVGDDDSSGFSDAPPMDNRGRQTSTTTPAARLPSPSSSSVAPRRAISRSRSLSPGWGDFFADPILEDDGGGGQDGFDTPPLPQPTRRRTSRPPPSTKTRRRIASSSPASVHSARSPPAQSAQSESDSNQSSASAPADKRERIARRMLPGVMLKRLAEAEQARRARKDAATTRRHDRTDSRSPVRPAHAAIRRGGRHEPDSMADFFVDSDEEDGGDEPVIMDMMAQEAGLSGADSDGPIVISSDDSGSEAGEDNRQRGLVDLQRGDFEALVRGRRDPAAAHDPDVRPRGHGELGGAGGGHDRERERERERERKKRHKRRRNARPALGLKKRVHRPIGSADMYQSRLDFLVVDKADAGSKTMARTKSRRDLQRSDSRRKTVSKPHQKPPHRPAIRLDDSVIFATDDFAFDSGDDEAVASREPPAAAVVVPAKRPFARVTSKTVAAGRGSASPARSSPLRPCPARDPRRALDEGVGKARSWANFDRFPIDFDITPLPSGVYCASKTVAGGATGRLGTMLALMDGTQPVDPKPVRAHGVDLHPGMGSDELDAVLPIVLDGATLSVRAFVDDHAKAPVLERDVAAPLAFLRDYAAASSPDQRAAIVFGLASFSTQLDEITLTGSKEDRPAVEQLLLVRYSLLEIALAANSSNVQATAAALVRLLLVYGFDLSLRPLKLILRGQADTPEIDDMSLAIWVALSHVLAAHDKAHASPSAGSADDTFAGVIVDALAQRFPNEVGPLAAERVWFLVFGLCALSQFGPDGVVAPEYVPHPRWGLVRRAVGLIKVTHSLEAEEAAHLDQLLGRDRYIKTMVARCLRLSSAWAWSFDRSSFSVATRDLGMIFKDRGHRNLPTEPPADFPAFIAEFDISLTASQDTKRSSAFELYLRLAAVAASDLIGSAEELSLARQAERDVQRLIMSIFPLSSVQFTRTAPPTPRQLGALINRYSTMVVACYFSPSLLPWLLANSAKWLAFESAGFESRQVVIRGLMYLAVACRHHSHPLDMVVARLADILAALQTELGAVGRPTNKPGFPTRVEIERTMVLVVTAFRQIILHTGYAPRDDPVYPDPALLHECWTARVFDLDLAKDIKSGREIVSTIQAFLDARAAALPTRARQARNTALESLDDYPSLGFDFDAVDLAALGGDGASGVTAVDPMEEADARFARIILDVICPKMYRLLSDMLPAELDDTVDGDERTDRQILIAKLTKCWSDCAAVVVVEHKLAIWTTYAGKYGAQSWSRLVNSAGRVQVGLHFMLNVAQLDPGAFRTLEEEFIALLFQTIVTDRLTIEHKYAAAVFALPGALDHGLFIGVRDALPQHGRELDRAGFMEHRPAILSAILGNIVPLLSNRHTAAEMKTLVYRCANVLVGAMVGYDAGIDKRRAVHRASYRAFVQETVGELKRVAGAYLTAHTVPTLKVVEEWRD